MKGGTPHCFGSPYRPCMLVGFRSVDLPSSPLLIVYNIHNFRIPPQSFTLLRDTFNIDKSLVNEAAELRRLVLGGDLNYDVPGEHKCNLIAPGQAGQAHDLGSQNGNLAGPPSGDPARLLQSISFIISMEKSFIINSDWTGHC